MSLEPELSRRKEHAPSRQASAAPSNAPRTAAEHPIHSLQRSIGNQSTAALLRRAQAEAQSEEPETDAGGAPGDLAPPIVYEALREGGAPLDPSVRRRMESHLGADFSSVRVHDSTLAHRAAASVDARAYTVGRDVVFGAPGLDPTDQRSVNTLAHELTHTVQTGGAPWSGEQLELDSPDTEAEHEARRVGATVAREIDRSPPDESPGIESRHGAPLRVMPQPIELPDAPAPATETVLAATPAEPTNESAPLTAPATPQSVAEPAAATAAAASATGGPATALLPGSAAGTEHATVRAVNQLALRLAASRGRSAASPGSPGQGPAAIRARRLSQAIATDIRAIEQPTESDLAELERELIDAFQVEAVNVTQELLARNEQIAQGEATRYRETSSGDAATPANRLRTAARAMGEVQQAIIDRVQAHGEQVAARVQVGGFGAPVGRIPADQFDDLLEGSYARTEPVVQSQLLPRLQLLKRIYGPEFPILLQRNLDYAAIANADPATLVSIVARSTSHVLQDIAELRKHLGDDPKGIWSLPAVVDATKLRMGIPLNASTPAGAAIDRYRAGLEQSAELIHLALAALGVAIALAAIAVSAGAATPVAGGIAASVASTGLATASAGLSTYGAVEAYTKYKFESAAAGSSLDPATALSHEQPSLLWLGAAIAFAVADLGAAGLAFHNLAAAWRAAQAANDLRLLEEAALAEARVLKAEGRLGTMTEDEFVRSVMDPARKQLGGAAAPPATSAPSESAPAQAAEPPASEPAPAQAAEPPASEPVAATPAAKPTTEEGMVTDYGRVNIKARVGDGLEGHEVWEHTYLKLVGVAGKRRGAYNAAILLTEQQHDLITALQQQAGLHSRTKLATMSARDVLKANAEIMLKAGVPARQVNEVVDYALEQLPALQARGVKY